RVRAAAVAGRSGSCVAAMDRHGSRFTAGHRAVADSASGSGGHVSRGASIRGDAARGHRMIGRGSRALLPLARWLAGYRREWLAHDLIAGVTLAAYGIPVALAYASLAGLPPEAGIYGYLAGGVAYALFGTSRQLAIGPTSAISLLVGSTLAGLA